MLTRIYIVISAIAVIVYALVAVSGYEFGSPQRKMMQPSTGRSAGWARGGTSFWHSGFRGGK